MSFGNPSASLSNNIYYAVNGANLNYVSGGLTTNPLFRNPGKGGTVGVWKTQDLQSNLDGYKLMAGSPAINAGITQSGYTFPTKDFYQNTIYGPIVDIGAFEWLGSATANYYSQDANNTIFISTISGSITGSADSIYMCNTSASSINIVVNPASLHETGNTRKIIVKKISNDSNIINIIPTTGSIDGATSSSISQYNTSVQIVSVGGNIYLI